MSYMLGRKPGLIDQRDFGATPTAFPPPGIIKIGTTEYTDFADAIADATSGDVIELGAGSFTFGVVTVPAGVIVRGRGMGATTLSATTTSLISMSTGSIMQNLTVNVDRTSTGTVSCVGPQASATSFALRNVEIIGDNDGSGSGANCHGVTASVAVAVILDNVYVTATSTNGTGRGLNVPSNVATIYAFGGKLDGSTYDVDLTAAGTVTLYGTVLANGAIGNSGAGAINQFGYIYPVTADQDVLNFNTNSLSDSDFVATISSKSGNQIVYTAPSSGDENNLKPQNTSVLAKMCLWNISLGTPGRLLIDDVDLGTNTITFTESVPGSWSNGHTVTIRSQANTAVIGGGRYYVDFEFLDGSLDPGSVWLLPFVQWRDSGAANLVINFHPYEANNNSKQFAVRAQVANQFIDLVTPPLRLINNRFCVVWDCSGNTGGFIVKKFGEG